MAYSQEGEDLLLLRLLEGKRDGFYVDIGAHHPSRFSNTRLLYELGWRGINVDALPGSMRAFRRERPRDVNIEAGISTAPGEAVLHRFAEPALSTFDLELAAERRAAGWQVAAQHRVPLRTLASVLDEAGAPPQLDLLAVDAEGSDLDVLRSSDWTRYRPSVVLMEAPATGGEIDRFLEGEGYVPRAQLVHSRLYLPREPGPTAP